MRISEVIKSDEEVKVEMEEAGKTKLAITKAINKRKKQSEAVQEQYDKRTSAKYNEDLAMQKG